MENINFTLDTTDIRKISDALAEMEDNMELIFMFGLLESKGSSVTVSTIDETLDFEELLDELGLEIGEPEASGGYVEFISDFDNEITEEDLEKEVFKMVEEDLKEERKNELDPKIKLMVQDSTPVATPVEAPKPKPAPEPTVVHGWDARVPRPTPDPDLMAQVNPIPANPATPGPTPEGMERVEGSHGYGFRPVPNETKPTPEPEPVKETGEPDLDIDEVCDGCGGFLSVNPHSDSNMNCDCGDDPYKNDAVESDMRVSGQRTNRIEPPEPEVTPAQEAGVSPSGGWTTRPTNPATDPNVWRT